MQNNLESQRLQYALVDRARELGWTARRARWVDAENSVDLATANRTQHALKARALNATRRTPQIIVDGIDVAPAAHGIHSGEASSQQHRVALAQRDIKVLCHLEHHVA